MSAGKIAAAHHAITYSFVGCSSMFLSVPVCLQAPLLVVHPFFVAAGNIFLLERTSSVTEVRASGFKCFGQLSRQFVLSDQILHDVLASSDVMILYQQLFATFGMMTQMRGIDMQLTHTHTCTKSLMPRKHKTNRRNMWAHTHQTHKQANKQARKHVRTTLV